MAKQHKAVPFDHDAPYARITSGDEEMAGIAYSQKGWYYDSNFEPVKAKKEYFEREARALEAEEKAAKARAAAEEEARALAALSDSPVVDQEQEARRENQRAAAAEILADV